MLALLLLIRPKLLLVVSPPPLPSLVVVLTGVVGVMVVVNVKLSLDAEETLRWSSCLDCLSAASAAVEALPLLLLRSVFESAEALADDSPTVFDNGSSG